MKKTLTINLSGMIYHIDEDAYLLLDKYLHDVKIHLGKETDAREIINDIEGRISELFSERINQGSHVITIEDVEEVIKRLGQPKDFGDSENDGYTQNQSQNSSSQSTDGNKKFYRNPDDKILGGVASGLAAYFNCDPTLIRLAFIICSIFWGSSIFIYILLWLIAPEAKTTAEKLEMKGEKINLENIGKTVTEGFEHMANDINSFVKSEKTRNGLQKAGDFFVSLVGICIKLFVAFFAVIAGIVVVCLSIALIAMISLLFVGDGMQIFSFFHGFPSEFYSLDPNYVLISIISVILIIGIPLFSLVYVCFEHVANLSPMTKTVKWALFVLWLAGIFMAINAGVQANFPALINM